jgi:hypothetical protein
VNDTLNDTYDTLNDTINDTNEPINEPINGTMIKKTAGPRDKPMKACGYTNQYANTFFSLPQLPAPLHFWFDSQ